MHQLYGSAPPMAARHVEPSAIASMDDEVRPSERLLDVALSAADRARSVDLSRVEARVISGLRYVTVWPGEHYRLLAALVEKLEARLVIEIGTFKGESALAMKQALPDGGRIVTYDILPWDQVPGHILRSDDFDGQLEQRIEDLSDPTIARANHELLAQADLLFVDAAKDGHQEQRFLDNFEEVRFASGPIAVFDDIRLWNMLAIWRGVKRPKLDVTSFGHWSGTGLVDYA